MILKLNGHKSNAHTLTQVPTPASPDHCSPQFFLAFPRGPSNHLLGEDFYIPVRTGTHLPTCGAKSNHQQPIRKHLAVSYPIDPLRTLTQASETQDAIAFESRASLCAWLKIRWQQYTVLKFLFVMHVVRHVFGHHTLKSWFGVYGIWEGFVGIVVLRLYTSNIRECFFLSQAYFFLWVWSSNTA